MKKSISLLVSVLGLTLAAHVHAGGRPNVVFIAVDDQNDWIGALGGHPAVKTPNIDRLARRGTVFLNANCQAPLCNPSRTSVMTGLRPTTTGIYGLEPWFRTLPRLMDRITLPQHFKASGYRTYATGKVFHEFDADRTRLKGEFEVFGPAGGSTEPGVLPPKKLIPPTPMGNHPLMDWGYFPHRDEDRADYITTSWAVERLQGMSKDEPFFLAVGIFSPHVPCYASQKWFNLYPDDDSLLPPVKADDRIDTPRFAWYLHWKLPEPRLEWLVENHQWRKLVRSYLASISFADSQVGRVLAALEASGQADNTIVVLWGDNGWHLGEKGITGKNSLWERSTRVPLIFAGPGVTPGGRCQQPAELLDMYPTLIELCGLPVRNDLEGISLTPQLRNAGTHRDRPALTTHNQGNHAIRSERYRFIHYADGSEEFYDLVQDPNEWTNLAAKPEFAGLMAEHRKSLPKVDLPPAPRSALRVLTYEPATDEFVWEGERFNRTSPIPH
jgi:arylsulfatase A-like enzyme